VSTEVGTTALETVTDSDKIPVGITGELVNFDASDSVDVTAKLLLLEVSCLAVDVGAELMELLDDSCTLIGITTAETLDATHIAASLENISK